MEFDNRKTPTSTWWFHTRKEMNQFLTPHWLTAKSTHSISNNEFALVGIWVKSGKEYYVTLWVPLEYV